MVVAITLQLRVPAQLSLGPRFVVPGFAALLLVALLLIHPTRYGEERHDLRFVSMLLMAAMSIGNFTTLGLLLRRLLNGKPVDGHRLVLAAAEIWITSVIIFGLWFWELDRGGPIARAKSKPIAPDLLFVQMSSPEWTESTWHPTLIDYLYVSLTNSTAFSPTDTPPLSGRMKALMGAQSLASLATVAVVGARAVNILK